MSLKEEVLSNVAHISLILDQNEVLGLPSHIFVFVVSNRLDIEVAYSARPPRLLIINGYLRVRAHFCVATKRHLRSLVFHHMTTCVEYIASSQLSVNLIGSSVAIQHLFTSFVLVMHQFSFCFIDRRMFVQDRLAHFSAFNLA